MTETTNNKIHNLKTQSCSKNKWVFFSNWANDPWKYYSPWATKLHAKGIINNERTFLYKKNPNSKFNWNRLWLKKGKMHFSFSAALYRFHFVFSSSYTISIIKKLEIQTTIWVENCANYTYTQTILTHSMRTEWEQTYWEINNRNLKFFLFLAVALTFVENDLLKKFFIQ